MEYAYYVTFVVLATMGALGILLVRGVDSD